MFFPFRLLFQITFRFVVFFFCRIFLFVKFASVLVVLLLVLPSFPFSLFFLLLYSLLRAILLPFSLVTFVNAVPLPVSPFGAGNTLARVRPLTSSLVRMGAGAAVPFLVSAHVQVGNVCTEGLVPAEAPFREALANGVTSNVGTVPSIRIVRPIVAAVVARFAEQLVVAALAEHNLPLSVLRLLRHPAFAATAPSF